MDWDYIVIGLSVGMVLALFLSLDEPRRDEGTALDMLYLSLAVFALIAAFAFREATK